MKKYLQNNLLCYPKDKIGWTLSACSLVIAGFSYLFRIKIGDIYLEGGLGFGFLIAGISPFLCLVACAFVFYIFVLLRYAIQVHYLPGLILFLGLWLALFVMPAPLSYEEQIFWKYQDEYEKLVNLAQNEKLPVSSECDGHGWAYAYPDQYKHLEGENPDSSCIYVYEGGVEFRPRSFYRPLFYFSGGVKINEFRSCGGDGWIYQELNSNWLICQIDFN
jgi:hypothetical protein